MGIVECSYLRYRQLLRPEAVLKYEELIATRARALAKFFPDAANLDEDLVSKNLNKHYDRALMTDLGARLLRREGAIWNFYSKDDVESLLSEIASSAPPPS